MRFSVGEDPRSRNGSACAGETFEETQASVETSAGRWSSARNGTILPILRAITQEKTAGIDTMYIEDASETHLTADGTEQQPSAPKGFPVRIVIYLVLLCLLGLVV